MDIILNSIGVVHSVLQVKEDCPRQEYEDAPVATIEIFPQFREGLVGLKPGTEILLFTWLHQSDRSVLRTHPRNDPNAGITGVFLTRSPDRPNPIGIHRVRIVAINEEGWLRVKALETLDGTPVIDLKSVDN